MKSLLCIALVFAALVAKGQQKTSNMDYIIDNHGDKLFTTYYSNPGKETVILLHGGPGFPSDLTPVANLLKEQFQIITFHQRGTRLSPNQSHDYSMAAYLGDLEAVRLHYGLEKFHLWGHSWGGLYAQIYAHQYPAHLISLFLCSPGSGTNLEWEQTEKEVMGYNRARSTSWQWFMMGIHSLLGRFGSDAAYRRLFKRVLTNYNEEFTAGPAQGIDFTLLRARPINKTRPEIIRYPLLARLDQPNFMISIVYGDKDIYQASKTFVLERYPTAHVSIISNCGHVPWLHQPSQYRQLLLAHFDRLN